MSDKPMVEIKDIAGFLGYRVDSAGSVWSSKTTQGVVTEKYRRMNATAGDHGYLFVRLCKDRQSPKLYVHRLVLEAFSGPCPPDQECRHLDGDPSNNDITNLKWGTNTENESDKVRHGTTNDGERNGMAKLTSADAEEIRNKYRAGNITQQVLADEYGVSSPTICRLLTGSSFRPHRCGLREA